MRTNPSDLSLSLRLAQPPYSKRHYFHRQTLPELMEGFLHVSNEHMIMWKIPKSNARLCVY
jgi:hypothetical protein